MELWGTSQFSGIYFQQYVLKGRKLEGLESNTDTHTINTETEKCTISIWLPFLCIHPLFFVCHFLLSCLFSSLLFFSVSPNCSISTRTVIASILFLWRVYCSLVYLGDYVVKYTFLDRICSESRVLKFFFCGSFD